jgi:integrase
MPAELSAKAVAALPPRRTPYWVAPNLYVSKAKPPGFWLLMYASPIRGKRVEMGLGSIATVPLRQVKLEAAEYRLMIARGRCPLTERQAEREARRTGHSRVRGPRTFEAIAEAYIAFHRPTWSSKKHAAQWESTLATYAYPVIGHLPVGRVDVGEVLEILEPIWRDKPETANRVRGRIETIVDYAKARKWFSGENPARWRGHLDQLLPSRSRVRPVEHQAAMPWREVPAFYQRLSRDRDISALALRYTIVNALRTGETRLATVDEIDRDQRLHTIAANRTKTRTELRVPLSDEALAVLEAAEARRTSPFLFGGLRVGKPISDMAMLEKLRGMAPSVTVHGFRSSFRDWCAENAAVPREIAEACLGHAVGSRVEAAYLRSDVLNRRRAVMAAWSGFLTVSVATEGRRMVLLHEEAAAGK